jgi:hypothetical protein
VLTAFLAADYTDFADKPEGFFIRGGPSLEAEICSSHELTKTDPRSK